MNQEFAIGQRVGDYEILAMLGTGGMGRVYKVRNVISDRVEAMKVLLSDLSSQKDLADRFLREIKLLASLNHPNVASLSTALTFENQLVMIMEFVQGVTIASRLQKGPIPASETTNYADQILDALGYAHRQNIVHRDVKPANMMLTPKGVVKLMDFGIARSASDHGLTMTGTTLGSLNYMPPEQVKGEAADARSDLYSLGVSLYEMVTGRLPFRGDSNYSLLAAHLNEVPHPPSTYCPELPAALDQIILMALAKDPKQRFQSADAFRVALKSVVFPIARSTPSPAAHSLKTKHIAAPGLFQEQSSTDASDQLFASPPKVVERPVVPVSSPTPKGHRGLYLALGALLALLVLFASGLYLPRRSATRADSDKGRAPQQTMPSRSSDSSSASHPPISPSSEGIRTSAPSPADAKRAMDASGGSEPSMAPPEPNLDTNPAARQRSLGGSKGDRTGSRSNSGARFQAQGELPQQNGAQESPILGNPAPSDNPPQFAELEKQGDQLRSRASAVSQSLDTLRNQQATQGVALRGNIAAAQERMNVYLSKGQVALEQNDAINAKKYFDLAEAELGKLETFLGH